MMDTIVVLISVVAIFCVIILVIIFLIIPLSCLIVRHVDKVDLLCILFSKKNMDLYSRYVSEADWSAVHCTEDVNSAYNSFYNIIQSAYKNAFPSKKFQRKEAEINYGSHQL